MADVVEVFKDDKGEWRWHRKAANHEVVSASGEGFINKEYALESAKSYNDGADIQVVE